MKKVNSEIRPCTNYLLYHFWSTVSRKSLKQIRNSITSTVNFQNLVVSLTIGVNIISCRWKCGTWNARLAVSIKSTQLLSIVAKSKSYPSCIWDMSIGFKSNDTLQLWTDEGGAKTSCSVRWTGSRGSGLRLKFYSLGACLHPGE